MADGGHYRKHRYIFPARFFLYGTNKSSSRTKAIFVILSWVTLIKTLHRRRGHGDIDRWHWPWPSKPPRGPWRPGFFLCYQKPKRHRLHGRFCRVQSPDLGRCVTSRCRELQGRCFCLDLQPAEVFQYLSKKQRGPGFPSLLVSVYQSFSGKKLCAEFGRNFKRSHYRLLRGKR